MGNTHSEMEDEEYMNGTGSCLILLVSHKRADLPLMISPASLGLASSLFPPRTKSLPCFLFFTWFPHSPAPAPNPQIISPTKPVCRSLLHLPSCILYLCFIILPFSCFFSFRLPARCHQCGLCVLICATKAGWGLPGSLCA